VSPVCGLSQQPGPPTPLAAILVSVKPPEQTSAFAPVFPIVAAVLATFATS
jgi:hypothetical protein